MTEYSFVEVLMISYRPGDKEYQDWFENEVELLDIAWEDATEEIEEVKQAKKEFELGYKQEGFKTMPIRHFNAPDLRIIKPITIFKFECFGQMFDREYCSMLDYERWAVGTAETFDGSQDELKKLGQQIIEGKRKQGFNFETVPEEDRCVRFITLWSFNSWQDSYYGDWEAEWNLEGLVDPKDVFLMLKEKIK